MSDTLIAYVISVIILAVIALLVPCIELLARLLRKPFRHEGEAPAPLLRVSGSSRKVA